VRGHHTASPPGRRDSAFCLQQICGHQAFALDVDLAPALEDEALTLENLLGLLGYLID
jgi:hypothetical protein